MVPVTISGIDMNPNFVKGQYYMVNKLYSSNRLRVQVLTKDGSRCKICGKTADQTVLEIDHIIPVSKGGKTTFDNLQTLCIDCNRGKSDLDL